MENKTTIKLSDGRELVVEVNNYDGNHEEICVYTLDKADPKNMLFQDICIVREDEKEPGRVECLVWADANEEDYTDRYSIGNMKVRNKLWGNALQVEISLMIRKK